MEVYFHVSSQPLYVYKMCQIILNSLVSLFVCECVYVCCTYICAHVCGCAHLPEVSVSFLPGLFIVRDNVCHCLLFQLHWWPASP